jgi:hypothetical protein
MLYDATVCIKFIYRTGYFFEAYAIISCVLPFNFKDIRLSLTLSVIFCDCPVREACCPRRPGQVSQATKAALRGNRASRTSRERVRCRRILRCCSEGRVSTACPGAHVRLLYPRYWPALPPALACSPRGASHQVLCQHRHGKAVKPFLAHTLSSVCIAQQTSHLRSG